MAGIADRRGAFAAFDVRRVAGIADRRGAFAAFDGGGTVERLRHVEPLTGAARSPRSMFAALPESLTGRNGRTATACRIGCRRIRRTLADGRTVADDTRPTAAEIADNSDTSNNSWGYLCMCPAVERLAFQAVELRTSAAFRAVELSGVRNGSAERRRPGANGCARCARLPASDGGADGRTANRRGAFAAFDVAGIADRPRTVERRDGLPTNPAKRRGTGANGCRDSKADGQRLNRRRAESGDIGRNR